MADLHIFSTPLPPEVTAALEGADLVATSIRVSERQTGRNPWWIVDSKSGTFFVKQLRGSPEDVRRRLGATNEFEQGRGGFDKNPVTTPRLHFSSTDGVLIYEYIADEPDRDIGARLRARSVAPSEMAPLGAFLASLHASDDAPSHSKSFGAMAASMDGLSLATFVEATAGQLSVLRRLHRDKDLRERVRRLAAVSEEARPLPGHGDLRVDQLLPARNGLMICDWEEYCFLDPAWELGSMAGDILSTALGGSQADFAERETRPWVEGEVTGSFEVRIRYALPLMAALIEAYEKMSPMAEGDATFRERVAGFCGWHLIERMLAAGSVGMSVSGLARGIGGVGRGILLDPRGLADMLVGTKHA